MEHKCLKIMCLLFVICLATVFLLDCDGTFGLFAGIVGVYSIWNS